MWETPPKDVHLETGSVHVWKAAPTARGEALAHYYESLADDERERAARFHFDTGRDGYVAARGVLRGLLGAYLRVAPAAVRLVYTARGKPELDPVHGDDLCFNLAHSGALVLLAFVRGARIGVDVERCRPSFDGQRIADRYFTEVESARLRAVGENDRVRAFTQQWARKESFIKAHGEGLSYPLNAFAVLEDENGHLRLDAGPVAGAASWHIRDLDAGDDYAAAVTVELTSPAVSTLSWQPDSELQETS